MTARELAPDVQEYLDKVVSEGHTYKRIMSMVMRQHKERITSHHIADSKRRQGLEVKKLKFSRRRRTPPPEAATPAPTTQRKSQTVLTIDAVAAFVSAAGMQRAVITADGTLILE